MFFFSFFLRYTYDIRRKEICALSLSIIIVYPLIVYIALSISSSLYALSLTTA